MNDQAQSRGIRVRNQALIREGGEQGRTAVLDCFEAGATALGLSWPKGHGDSLMFSYSTYTIEEIDRLLAVCDKAKLPDLAGVSPAQWWRTLIVRATTTGQRLSEILEHDLAWPYSRRVFYRALRDLFQAAGIDCNDRPTFHGLRRFYFEQQQLEEGGAVA